MKPKKLNKKLALRKTTVAHLNNREMIGARGGIWSCQVGTPCSIAVWCSDPASDFDLCRPTAMCTGPGATCDTNDTCDTSIIC